MDAHPIRICQNCSLAVSVTPVETGHNAYCPRCNTQLYRGGSASLSGNLALAVTCLALFIPCFGYNYLQINLFSLPINASFSLGIKALFDEDYNLLALLVLFCGFIAPLVVCSSVLTAHFALANRRFKLLDISLHLIHSLKHWVMVDVFLVSVAIACFKLRDYADISISPPLYGLLLLQFFTVTLLSRISVRRYWESWQSEASYEFANKEIHCTHCHLSQPLQTTCVRCQKPIIHLGSSSAQKTWSFLLAAAICFIPANWLSISILMSNGQRMEDTIFSGVVSLINSGMVGIGLIIFIASIVVPAIKIIGLAYLLLSVHLKQTTFLRQRMLIYFILKWIGKWSMIDLFVISIMLTLVDRGQVLDFTPGYGAIAFGFVVVFTMLATESFDPKSIWEHQHNENG